MTHFLTRRRFARACATLATAGLTLSAQAAYPERPVELVVPYTAGGGTDAVARAFADAVRKHLPQPVVVVNKTGAGGAIGLTEVMNARPDGAKIGVGTVEITMLPHLGVAKFGIEDFVPIAMLNVEPSAITVRADAPWTTVEAFLADAKARPAQLRVGNSGTGAIWHIAAESLSEKAGVRFLHVPYAGANPAVADLLGGHIEAVTVSPPEVAQHVAAGKLRILAVMSAQRAPKFPQVPTLKERGVDVQISTWRGLVAPKATPEPVLTVLREAARKAVQEPAYRATMDKLDLNAVLIEGDAFRDVMKRDNEFFKSMIAKLGVTK
jgi:tripartite-type tricarboxylate transporter receptor subunit TctC